MRRLTVEQTWAAWQRFARERGRAWRLRERLRYHRWPLLAIGIALLIGQLAIAAQSPLVSTNPDSPSYTDGAWAITQSLSGLISSMRLPGYPLFLAVVFTLTGGTDYGVASTCTHVATTAICDQTFRVIFYAQILVYISTMLLCYVLFYRLTHRRWIAAVVAVAFSVNLYMLSWERQIYSELLSYFVLLIVFLCFDRFLRTQRMRWAVLFGLSVFAAIMVRPFNIMLPLVLLPLLLVWLLFMKRLRATWRQFAAASLIVAGGCWGYMLLNLQINHYYGLTYDHNITLLGKLFEYDMVGLPVDATYHQIQADAVAYNTQAHAQGIGRSPWIFAMTYHYDADYYSLAGEFAQAEIKSHPLTYLRKSLPDLRAAWIGDPKLYATYGLAPDGSFQKAYGGRNIYGVTNYPQILGVGTRLYEPVWVTGLLAISTLEQRLYVLLPILLIALGWLLWKRPRRIETFEMLCILLSVTAACALAALGNYAEFYRERMPYDWGVLGLSLVALAQGVSIASRQVLPAAKRAYRQWQARVSQRPAALP